VGRLVACDAMWLTIEGEVLIHDHGSWGAFAEGRLEADGQRAHVSCLPADRQTRLPRLQCITRPWGGDFEALRAWADK
jgi:hypothetical protein